ncbi:MULTISPECIES: ABC transporter permease [unclassified Paracoccus (in: a-proteobacteria)]|uniref:ABC transporter permease n=1 Tax=unclassified Paracoccus (in: a-proteobacteria) TaxID=2688777 RepID=UPI001601F40A|nr:MULTISPECIES: ABC transporter permease [unclassified Paracoccus (in: a-proteobacteria)]MBB1491322.1 ABC transporter permease [Paracoccus sp. MC1854]MBB1498100.1 ABC transporter permease [Paracoccus sp. MC1862]QQO46218.1 ABC transporter permease [Paracoccus sp. MC1862]
MTALHDLWAGLPAGVQDALIVLALLLPGLVAGIIVLRGFAPGGLVRAMLRRFAGTNAAFVALIALSVGLGAALTAQERGLREGSARAAAPFDVIVAAPGSEITMLMAAVYLQPSDVPLLTGAQYAEVSQAPGVELAAPLAFGDSYEGAPLVGTTADFVTHLAGDLAEGRLFEAVDEAVAGAFAPVEVGASFTPVHGHGPEAESHEGSAYVVTGRMRPSGSPWDRAVLVPVEGVWQVHGLPDGHAEPAAAAHDHHDHDHAHEGQPIGPPFDPALFPGTPALLLKADSVAAAYALQSQFNRPDMMAFFPGTVLAQMHGLMRDVREAMSLMAGLTQILVTVAVLAGLMILARVFARGFALLQAIGAPRRFVFAVMWGYSAALIVTGAVLGLGVGWLAARGLSAVVTARTDILVTAGLGWTEAKLVAGFVSATLVLALLPAAAITRRLKLSDLRA